MLTESAVSTANVARNRPRRRLAMPRVPLLMLLPAIVYLVVMTQAPFVVTLWYSVHTWIMTSPELGKPWVGLDNFNYTVLQDPTFRDAVVNTLVMTISIVGVSLILGMAFALLLHRPFPLRGLVRSLMITPFFVMPTVSAVVWKNLLLNPVFGLFNWITTSLGMRRTDWLGVHPTISLVTICVWEWTPFMMLILLAGLQGQSEEVREAAHLDGASGVAEFWHITLPQLGRYVQLAVLLGMIYVLQLFGEIFVATSGGPGTETTTVPFYVYQTISQSTDVGSSSAQGVLAVIFASILATLLLRLLAGTFSRSAT